MRLRVFNEALVVTNPAVNATNLITLLASAFLDRSRPKEAVKWLDRLPVLNAVEEAFEAAIQEKRAGRMERAHRYFLAAEDTVMRDAKALHEFAQVKMKLAGKARPRGRHGDWRPCNNLLDEAREMLQRVVQVTAPRLRHAWAWFDLGKVLRWRRAPLHDVRHAFEEAVRCEPDEPRFQEALDRLDEKFPND